MTYFSLTIPASPPVLTAPTEDTATIKIINNDKTIDNFNLFKLSPEFFYNLSNFC